MITRDRKTETDPALEIETNATHPGPPPPRPLEARAVDTGIVLGTVLLIGIAVAVAILARALVGPASG